MADAFDTTIPGTPEDLYEASSWLTDCFNSLTNAQDDLVHAAALRDVAWQGDASDAYFEVAHALSGLIMEIHARLKDAADILTTYGDQLRRAQRDMAVILDEARGAGIPTSGTIVHHPFSTLTPGHYAAPSFTGEAGLAARRARHYDHLESEAERATDELEHWVVGHVVPFATRLKAIDLNGLLTDLATSLGISSVELTGGQLIANSESLSIEAARLTNAADRAASLSPFHEIGLPSRHSRALTRTAHSRLAASELTHRLGSGLSGLASVGDVVATASSVWASDDPSSELVGAGGGTLAALGAEAAGAGFVSSAIGIAVAGVGTKYLYRNTTPLATQEHLDDLIECQIDRVDDAVDKVIRNY